MYTRLHISNGMQISFISILSTKRMGQYCLDPIQYRSQQLAILLPIMLVAFSSSVVMYFRNLCLCTLDSTFAKQSHASHEVENYLDGP